MAYKITSPWHDTAMANGYLGNFNIRPVSAEPDDIPYTIDPHYNYRPDLLSQDLYGTPKLWWVFTQRNMNVIRDPIFDFKVGTLIYLPKKTTLFRVLGI
jgi:hypothetical protein